jgi:hypothetical protein
MKMIPSALVFLIILGVGVYVFMSAPWQRPAPPPSTYLSSIYGISFSYPETYALQEREVGNGERYHYVITLIDKDALANVPVDGEGPPAISIDIYQNNLDKQKAEEWIRGSGFSNFKLSPDGAIRTTTAAGVPAYSYTWDGLYRGESVVFAHKGNIIMASVSYLSAEDAIRSDFSNILASLALY